MIPQTSKSTLAVSVPLTDKFVDNEFHDDATVEITRLKHGILGFPLLYQHRFDVHASGKKIPRRNLSPEQKAEAISIQKSVNLPLGAKLVNAGFVLACVALAGWIAFIVITRNNETKRLIEQIEPNAVYVLPVEDGPANYEGLCVLAIDGETVRFVSSGPIFNSRSDARDAVYFIADRQREATTAEFRKQVAQAESAKANTKCATG